MYNAAAAIRMDMYMKNGMEDMCRMFMCIKSNGDVSV